MKHKFKKGDKVIYKGLIGIIEKLTTSYAGTIMYSLVAEEDEEMTCTADEKECEKYIDQEVDQSEALGIAKLESAAIANLGESLTDKNFRDGNH